MKLKYNFLCHLVLLAVFIWMSVEIGLSAEKSAKKVNQNVKTKQTFVNKTNTTTDANKQAENDFAGLGGDSFSLKAIEDFSILDWIWSFIRKYPLVTYVLIMLFSLFIWCFWRLVLKDKAASAKNAKGRTANDEEIREYEYVPESGQFYLGQNYPIENYSKWKGEVGIPFGKRSQHGFVEAPTGSGKTTCFVVKQLIDDGLSRVVNTITFDRKGKEQFNKTSKIYRDLGHRVLYLSPWNRHRSMGFEPLFGADEMELTALVEGHVIISADPNDSKSHFRTIEQEILLGVFKTLKRQAMCQGPSGAPKEAKCKYENDQAAQIEETRLSLLMREKGEKMRPHPEVCMCRRKLATLPYAAHIISLGYNPLRTLVQHYSDIWAECPTLRPANANPRTNEMLSGLKGKMRYYLTDGPKQVFSRSDFTLDEITNPKPLNYKLSTILYIDAPQQQGRSAAVLSSVMSQLIYQKINARREIMEKNNWSGSDVKLLSLWFDEIGTFTIPEVNSMLATMRDTNTGAVLLLQDQKQLQLFYEKVVPDTIHSNSYFKIYTGTINEERAKLISDSIGTKIASEKSFAYDPEYLFPKTFGRRRTLKQVEVPILAPNEIQFMCKPKWATKEQSGDKVFQDKHNLDGLAIVSSDRPPFVIKKWAYFREPKHSALNLLINDSVEWNNRQQMLIQKEDERRAARPKGEVPRFKDEIFNWESVPKVNEALAKELLQDDSFLPVTDKQKRIIYAKCRDLIGQPDEKYLDSLATKDYRILKSFCEMSKRDGEILIVILEEKLKKKRQETNSPS